MKRLFFALLLLCGAASVRAEVRLLTSIKPLQLIAAAVQEGVGQPTVLLPPGASPHHYSLRPSDLRRLQEARLFYWIGPDLEGFLGQPLTLRSGPSLALQALPGLQLRHFAEAGHDGRDEHDHAHRSGSLDVHLWLLPANARVIAARMAADLARVDPANATHYQNNLAAFGARLDSLDQQLSARLTRLKGKPYFVFHETYDYFEQAYGLQHAGVFAIQGEVQPGARHIAELREQLQQAGPSCVFSEPPLPPRLAQTLSAGLPVRLAELDAMGNAVPVDARGYERLLENLAATLSDCLQPL